MCLDFILAGAPEWYSRLSQEHLDAVQALAYYVMPVLVWNASTRRSVSISHFLSLQFLHVGKQAAPDCILRLAVGYIPMAMQ